MWLDLVIPIICLFIYYFFQKKLESCCFFFLTQKLPSFKGGQLIQTTVESLPGQTKQHVPCWPPGGQFETSGSSSDLHPQAGPVALPCLSFPDCEMGAILPPVGLWDLSARQGLRLTHKKFSINGS